MKINDAPCQRPGGLELTRRGLALCDFPTGGPIADVGCGAGATLRLLRERGFEAVGIDAQPSAPEIIKGRAEALPFPPESLAGIVCECVLSLCEEYQEVLKGFWAACRPGAFLLLSDLYGAVYTRQELENALEAAAWRLRCFEDQARALREYAAQALWRGEECLPGSKNLGYGLWVAYKEAL